MTLQSAVMKNPTLTRLVMSRTPSSVLDRMGQQFRHRAVLNAVRETVAYPAFLIENGLDPEGACLPERFETLPLTSKQDYVDRYPLDQRCRGGKLYNAYLIEKSSGHSGGSYYWPRTPQEDALVPAYLEYLCRQYFHVETTPSLGIIALALGTWIAGEKSSTAMRQVAASGRYPLTIMSPGPNVDEVIDLVRDLSPHYQQTLLAGYPPFIRAVLEEGAARGIDWPAVNLKLVLGGEAFSEQWRAYIGGLIGVDVRRDLVAITSSYAAADLGMVVGREQPLTTLVRQLCLDDSRLAADLFDGAVPIVFQYSPASMYIEEVDSEVVFTTMSGAPLVRYAIHDRGGVASFDHVMGVLADHGYDVIARLKELGFSSGDVWRLPLFWVNGRTDGTIAVNGANVYDENIETVLAEVSGGEIVGHKAGRTSDHGRSQPRLLVLLEHRDADLTDAERTRLAARYRLELTRGLVRVNADYAIMYGADPAVAEPIVRVYGRGRGPFAEERGRIKKDYSLQ